MASYTHEESLAEASLSARRIERLSEALEAVIEETDIRIAELKKDAFEFKRDIVMGAENMRSGKTTAEKLMRHMEDNVRQRDVLIEKLRLKNTSIKTQIQKVEAQLKQKEELGDVLHYIDFHQLQIENKQYQTHIERRNAVLLGLKKITGETIQSLNHFKFRLQRSLTDSRSFHREIRMYSELLCKVRVDIYAVHSDVISEYRTGRRLGQQQHETLNVPSVLTYVAEKVVFIVFVCHSLSVETKTSRALSLRRKFSRQKRQCRIGKGKLRM